MSVNEHWGTVKNTIKCVLEIMTDSESDSDDEINAVVSNVLIKEKEKVIRVYNYLELTVPKYNKRQFQEHFRLRRETYETLLQEIGPTLKRKGNIGRQTISVEKQLLSSLWLLATPDSYRSVGDRFDMSKSSLSVSFVRVIQSLNEIASNIIRWPTGNEVQRTAQRFASIAGLQNVIGAIDGTFIPIKAPKEDPEVYVTRKCNYAITLQATCNTDLVFTDIFVGYPGSVSDTRIFRNSHLYEKVSVTPANFFPNEEYIIGDKAYPLLPWCIPPYKCSKKIQRNSFQNSPSDRKVICVIIWPIPKIKIFGHEQA